MIGDTGTEQIEWERERGNSGDLNRKNSLTPVDERADGDTDALVPSVCSSNEGRVCYMFCWERETSVEQHCFVCMQATIPL